MLKGSCLCGSIEYAFRNPPEDFIICHCNMCQKFHGAAAGPYLRFPDVDFEILKGGEYEVSFESSDIASRVFCNKCGSSLRYIYRQNPEIIFVAAGVVDGDPISRPTQHIFVGNKCCWQEICDNLPRAETWA